MSGHRRGKDGSRAVPLPLVDRVTDVFTLLTLALVASLTWPLVDGWHWLVILTSITFAWTVLHNVSIIGENYVMTRVTRRIEEELLHRPGRPDLS